MNIFQFSEAWNRHKLSARAFYLVIVSAHETCLVSQKKKKGKSLEKLVET